jgi:titin
MFVYLFRSLSRSSRSAKCLGQAVRPTLEGLEFRLAPATFTVTNPGDAGAGTLRQAILDSNGAPGLNRIEFAIGGGGVQTIHPTSALPTITVPVTIDGTTQPGFAGTPLIVLDGSSAGASTNGLTITAGNSTVKGLVVSSFAGPSGGIQLSGPGGNTIAGNYIGTDVTGTQARGNAGHGVLILDSGNNTIGGTASGARNLISGNQSDAIQIIHLFGSVPTGNVVQADFIGTDVTGTWILANQGDGVQVIGCANSLIGGTAAGAGNVIAGNTGNGVSLSRSGLPGTGATGNVVQGNRIGTDATGTHALANQNNGINLTDTGPGGNTIGGLATGAGNVIAANSASGIAIVSSSSGNVVQGNWIGTDVTGMHALGNGQLGVGIVGAGTSNNLVGGTAAGARNVISASLHNNNVGIFGGATANTVQGNYIGTDVSGTVALGSAVNGVGISDAGTSNNLIGGTAAGAGNVISGNVLAGIQFFNGCSGNTVQGNTIGTDYSGTQPLGNTYAGVAISGAANNTIGGTTAGAGNLISGNIGNGVRVEVSGTTGNLVEGNLIGTDVSGTLPLGNGTDGVDSAVLIDMGASNNTLGGTTAGAGNVIAADSLNGVRIRSANGNLVQGNLIGTDVTGTVALGNAADGVAIGEGSSGNLIGGTAPGAGNVISANGLDGVHLFNGATGNTVQGNHIGTDVSGSQSLGNGRNGVHFEDTSNNNLLGGTTAGAGNVIAYSGNDGVLVDTASGDAIRQNSIHDSGNLGIELVNGGNHNQAFPVLTIAVSDGSSTTITGSLQSTPDTAFTLEFFANAAPNPSGYGEGQSYPGSWLVTTDDNGNASFTVNFVSGDTTGQFIAATATDPANNTSSFSLCLVVTPGGAPPGPRGSGRAALPAEGLNDSGAVALLSDVTPGGGGSGSLMRQEFSSGDPPPSWRVVDAVFRDLSQDLFGDSRGDGSGSALARGVYLHETSSESVVSEVGAERW